MACIKCRTFFAVRPKHGFTLTELLVVLIILASIGLLATPSSNDRQERLRQTGARLIADLEYAQLASIGRADDPCVVVFDLPGQRYILARASDTTEPMTHPGTGAPYAYILSGTSPSESHGVSLSSIDLGGDGMVSYGVHGGLNESGSLSVVLGSGSQTLTISIDADSGEASVLD